MKIVNKLIEYGVIQEFNDWAQHFLAGTKGQPKTDPLIIDYVTSLLNDSYPDQPEKVRNCKLAPWLVDIVKTIGPENIGTAERVKLMEIISWFKTSATDAPLKGKDLNGAYDYVVTKNAEMQKKVERANIQTENNYVLPAEEQGRIKRISNVGDGSGRIWVEVLDGKWLGEPSQFNPMHKWGVKCQSEEQHGFWSPNMLNVQLLGPPKGNPNGPWSTQLAIASRKGTGEIKEIKQEGNQQPGSMKTSAGYSDGAEMVISFLCGNPFAKQHFKKFGLYHGGVPAGNGIGLYGGDAFLAYIANSKPELFNRLMDCRRDILENNRDLIIALKGNEWFEEREINLSEMAANEPENFLMRFERLLERFGAEAVELLGTIDYTEIFKQNQQLLQNCISSLVGNIPAEKFLELFRIMDLKEYVRLHPDKFKDMLKYMANNNQYKNVLEYIMNNNTDLLLSAFGNSTKGVMQFMSFAAFPRLKEHKNAIWDDKKKEYWVWKQDLVRDENGNVMYDGNGQRITKQVKRSIPDSLAFMPQKERRQFLIKNKDYIMSTMKGSQMDNLVSYLKILIPQMSFQEANKMFETNNLKGKIIDYFDKRYNEFKSDEKKGMQYLMAKYGVTVNGKKALQSFQPGIMEFHRQFNLGKKEQPKPVVEELMSKIEQIQKYYYDKSQKTGDANKGIDSFVDTLEFLKKNGATDQELIELIKKTISKSINGLIKNPALLNRLLADSFEKLSRSNAMSEVEKVKSIYSRMGYEGEQYYQDLKEKFSVPFYAVKSGDMVEFKGNDNQTDKYKLKEGRKYQVIETRDTYFEDFDNEEEQNELTNIKEMNGEVLVSEDSPESGMSQNIWVPSERFKIRKEYKTSKNKLNESFVNFSKNLKRLKSCLKEEESRMKPRYTAIMLDNDSILKLQDMIDELKNKESIGSNWTISADHVTINMGAAKPEMILGQQVNVTVVAIGENDMVVALQVKVDKSIDFKGRTPHITLAYNKEAGAKPVMSNSIKEWKRINPMDLRGSVEEVY